VVEAVGSLIAVAAAIESKSAAMSTQTEAERKEQALADYRKKLLKHKEVDTKVRSLRETVKELKREYDKTEDDLKALQSVGQIIGEVLRQLDEERCECSAVFALVLLRMLCSWRVQPAALASYLIQAVAIKM